MAYSLADAVRNLPIPAAGLSDMHAYDAALSAASDFVRDAVLLDGCTDDQLRAEARKRGLELHSKLFSDKAQELLREVPKLRKQMDHLEQIAKSLG